MFNFFLSLFFVSSSVIFFFLSFPVFPFRSVPQHTKGHHCHSSHHQCNHPFRFSVNEQSLAITCPSYIPSLTLHSTLSKQTVACTQVIHSTIHSLLFQFRCNDEQRFIVLIPLFPFFPFHFLSFFPSPFFQSPWRKNEDSIPIFVIHSNSFFSSFFPLLSYSGVRLNRRYFHLHSLHSTHFFFIPSFLPYLTMG